MADAPRGGNAIPEARTFPFSSRKGWGRAYSYGVMLSFAVKNHIGELGRRQHESRGLFTASQCVHAKT